MFKVIVTNFEYREIAYEKDIIEEMKKALFLMFDSYVQYEMNCSLTKYALHIHTKNSEEFRELIRLYAIATQKNRELMKVIAINKD